MQDTLVAINVCNSSNVLMNKTNVPILFYWNGDDNIQEAIRTNDNFINFVTPLFMNPDNYIDLSVSYFYFKYNEETDEEIYKEKNEEMQDLIMLDNFNSDNIVKHYLVKHFLKLYSTSTKEEYNGDKTNVDDTICDIYKILKDKFRNRIIKSTVINWVRSVLTDETHLTQHNTDFIIEKLEKILINID